MRKTVNDLPSDVITEILLFLDLHHFRISIPPLISRTFKSGCTNYYYFNLCRRISRYYYKEYENQVNYKKILKSNGEREKLKWKGMFSSLDKKVKVHEEKEKERRGGKYFPQPKNVISESCFRFPSTKFEYNFDGSGKMIESTWISNHTECFVFYKKKRCLAVCDLEYLFFRIIDREGKVVVRVSMENGEFYDTSDHSEIREKWDFFSLRFLPKSLNDPVLEFVMRHIIEFDSLKLSLVEAGSMFKGGIQELLEDDRNRIKKRRLNSSSGIFGIVSSIFSSNLSKSSSSSSGSIFWNNKNKNREIIRLESVPVQKWGEEEIEEWVNCIFPNQDNYIETCAKNFKGLRGSNLINDIIDLPSLEKLGFGDSVQQEYMTSRLLGQIEEIRKSNGMFSFDRVIVRQKLEKLFPEEMRKTEKDSSSTIIIRNLTSPGCLRHKYLNTVCVEKTEEKDSFYEIKGYKSFYETYQKIKIIISDSRVNDWTNLTLNRLLDPLDSIIFEIPDSEKDQDVFFTITITIGPWVLRFSKDYSLVIPKRMEVLGWPRERSHYYEIKNLPVEKIKELIRDVSELCCAWNCSRFSLPSDKKELNCVDFLKVFYHYFWEKYSFYANEYNPRRNYKNNNNAKKKKKEKKKKKVKYIWKEVLSVDFEKSFENVRKCFPCFSANFEEILETGKSSFRLVFTPKFVEFFGTSICREKETKEVVFKTHLELDLFFIKCREEYLDMWSDFPEETRMIECFDLLFQQIHYRSGEKYEKYREIEMYEPYRTEEDIKKIDDFSSSCPFQRRSGGYC